MSASAVSPARERVVMGIILAAIILRLGLASAPGQPPRLPADQAETWMADALPGVGAKRRDQAVEAIRRGDIEALPKQAREAARACFDLP